MAAAMLKSRTGLNKVAEVPTFQDAGFCFPEAEDLKYVFNQLKGYKSFTMSVSSYYIKARFKQLRHCISFEEDVTYRKTGI